jgi:transcriptional regulator with XRE-family HTH domain
MKSYLRNTLVLRREALGRSRNDLAKRLGITRFHVYNVESGRKDASPELMARWSRELGVTLSAWTNQDRARYYGKLALLELDPRDAA